VLRHRRGDPAIAKALPPPRRRHRLQPGNARCGAKPAADVVICHQSRTVPRQRPRNEFDQEFDLAITVGSLGHILPRDEPRFVERIHAALRPGGRFAFVTSTMPPVWSRRYLVSRAFNGAMHVRNLLVRPPFVMFYLTFLLPDIARLLETHGFSVAVHDDIYPAPFHDLRVVVATRQ
jgi:cyclopropane fatty-acyl-phospholipid synthase-like methyltransferase